MELKITGNQESLTLQNKTHILQTETTKTFRTDRLGSFKDYLGDRDQAGSCAVSVYYTKDSVVAWPCEAATGLDRYAVPLATCGLVFSDELKILTSHINQDIDECDFCQFLRKMAKYGDMLSLKDSIENMEMKKIVSMSRSKDSRGNFAYEYSMKDHGKATFNPPPRLSFTIPVFRHIEKNVVFEPDFVFSYCLVGTDEAKHAVLTYRLEMLNFDQFVEQACTAIVEDEMKSFTYPKYWGELTKENHTDDWRYKDVPLRFEGLPSDNVTNNDNSRKY